MTGVALTGGEEPADPRTPGRRVVVSLDDVSKAYLPPPPMRLRRLFSRLGGLHVEDGFGPDALAGIEDDEDELDDDGPLEDDPLLQAGAVLGRRVIDGVTLQARAGTTVALVGEEGAGKTTLLKLIGGIIPPSSGRVMVRGTVAPALGVMGLVLPARGHTVKAALPQLGAMVGIPPRHVRDRFDAIVDLMEVPALLQSSTSLMESRRKRELIVAMALSLEPDVLLLDMPLAFDEFGDRCVQRLAELRAGGTLVVAEMRDPRKTRIMADRVLLLDRGRLLPDVFAVSVRRASPRPG